MVNKAALLEMIPVMRKLAADNRFNMGLWAQGPVTPDAESYHECGTTFCFAGAKAAFDGWRPQYRKVYEMNRDSHPWLTPDMKFIASGDFVRPEDRHVGPISGFDEDDRIHAAEDIAAEALDLGRDQAVFLFYATWLTHVEDLVLRIEFIADGGVPDEYTGE